MDEYEVKVHALEDMEEGEVTSDEEGEIKGVCCWNVFVPGDYFIVAVCW